MIGGGEVRSYTLSHQEEENQPISRPYLAYISPISHQEEENQPISRLLEYISPKTHQEVRRTSLYLAYISPISRLYRRRRTSLYLAYISPITHQEEENQPISRLYLPYIASGGGEPALLQHSIVPSTRYRDPFSHQFDPGSSSPISRLYSAYCLAYVSPPSIWSREQLRSPPSHTRRRRGEPTRN